ncbi:AAA family ATPase [Candidatus Parcubacteria bacterium]|nr:AAA family ATPase [Candidatus Parcubacteria bacterium]
MYLKSIEISGFKSFAKKNGFSFNTPISAIVGPNGSGKSNVAESFRFVLGEQSIKSMRGKRGEDLIWNGSPELPRGNRASVKVVFDNERKIFDIDFPEVTIERVVHRDGLNEYSINGSPVRLKDVIELLAKAHIGSSGHHIISQGEADKIISATPKDRKAMVEDALGLKIYQYKRLESERKLEKAFENIAQVEGLRKEIAPHLKFLKKQVEKLEKTESLREELITLAKEYFKREEAHITESKKRLEAERKPVEEELKKLSKQSAEAKEVMNLEKDLTKIRGERDLATRELGKLEGLIETYERQIEAEKGRAAREELKTVRLKEVEDLFEEVKAFAEVAKVFDRITAFIRERKHQEDSRLISELSAKIVEAKKRKGGLEALLKAVQEKEQKIIEAEKVALTSEVLEKELVSKLNFLKSREATLQSEEAAFRRELAEVGHVAGASALKYHDVLATDDDRAKQEERRHALERLKIRLEEASIAGSDEIMKEYRETSERDSFLERELADLEKSAGTLKGLIKDLETRLATEFETGLKNINKEFGKLFAKVFDGGEAGLALIKNKTEEEEGEQSIEEGLEIKVSLPRKKVKSLMMLSGGERALTSIALIFAISAVNPPPFIILDETDAALDEANSRKYGDMIEILAKYSQLILITHNRETMSRAGVIYGVTMGGNGISKVLSISFDEASEVAK